MFGARLNDRCEFCGVQAPHIHTHMLRVDV